MCAQCPMAVGSFAQARSASCSTFDTMCAKGQIGLDTALAMGLLVMALVLWNSYDFQYCHKCSCGRFVAAMALMMAAAFFHAMCAGLTLLDLTDNHPWLKTTVESK
ncbi:hypothetical protein H257_14053 [Aphanomyces astaci]|uniref:Uncharacterized protein n=1 Tax=Aphanomyces astaci TaxID=112090 RepID=W4FU64_APHAT|nr:hypothetical protein H257_14053 [Aphanomyces astaci]ETV70369.1 hypothetical protein H257_14053 [Aphanomyces astaci]|eukprot:XP_009840081.1 hypothetical protein H257_14053 [Aphanomyces astaci]